MMTKTPTPEFVIYINNKIDEIHRQAVEEGWTFYTYPMPAEDWANRYGITTIEAYEDHMTLATFSDVYKDYYGVRPRFDVTVEEAQKWLNDHKKRMEMLELRKVEEEERFAKVMAEIDPNNKVRNTALEDALKSALK